MIQLDFSKILIPLLNCLKLWIKIPEIKESIRMIYTYYVGVT